MLEHRFLFFFFFQAEDGIRDWSVTGVQTCALPIFGDVCSAPRSSFPRSLPPAAAEQTSPSPQSLQRAASNSFASSNRSEERRVGKECRSRWRRAQWKKTRESVGRRRQQTIGSSASD